MHPSPEERLHEVAVILAVGFLRLRQRAALPTDKQPENQEKPPPDGLDVSAKTRLSVRVG
jgi:hypothetical protein